MGKWVNTWFGGKIGSDYCLEMGLGECEGRMEDWEYWRMTPGELVTVCWFFIVVINELLTNAHTLKYVHVLSQSASQLDPLVFGVW